MTPSEDWRPVVNGVLYSVQFREILNEELAVHTARSIIHRPLAGLTAEEQYAALTTAVQSGTELTWLEPESHNEGDFRAFLSMVLHQMNTLRPWPEPSYERVELSRWSDFQDPVVIGRLTQSPPKVEKKTATIFSRLDDTGQRAAVLRLRSGALVALVARWWPDSNNVAVITQGSSQPDDVVRELLDATQLSEDVVTRTSS